MEGLSGEDACTAFNLLAEASTACQDEFAHFGDDPDRTDTVEVISSDSEFIQ